MSEEVSWSPWYPYPDKCPELGDYIRYRVGCVCREPMPKVFYGLVSDIDSEGIVVVPGKLIEAGEHFCYPDLIEWSKRVVSIREDVAEFAEA